MQVFSFICVKCSLLMYHFIDLFFSHDRGGQRGHGNRGHHQGNRNYNQGHRGNYQGNKGHYQRDRGHYQENRGYKQGNRGHYGGHRGGYHGDWHGRDKNRDNRQQQKHEHSNSDLRGRPSQQGPSRVFYPGMKDFEQAQIQSQARYHPYQRGDQTHTQGSHSQSTAQQGQNQGPT